VGRTGSGISRRRGLYLKLWDCEVDVVLVVVDAGELMLWVLESDPGEAVVPGVAEEPEEGESAEESGLEDLACDAGLEPFWRLWRPNEVVDVPPAQRVVSDEVAWIHWGHWWVAAACVERDRVQ
jgi:hypothetical protein